MHAELNIKRYFEEEFESLGIARTCVHKVNVRVSGLHGHFRCPCSNCFSSHRCEAVVNVKKLKIAWKFRMRCSKCNNWCHFFLRDYKVLVKRAVDLALKLRKHKRERHPGPRRMTSLHPAELCEACLHRARLLLHQDFKAQRSKST